MPSDEPIITGQEQINGMTVDKQGFHLDLEKTKEAILSGASASSSEDGPAIVGEATEIDGLVIDKQGFHLDKDDLAANILASMKQSPIKKLSTKGKSSKNAGIDLGVFQPIWEELQEIPFSENYEEIGHIRNAIRQAAKDIKAKKIVANTQALVKNAQKFYHSDEGMRVIFSVLGTKFSMAAKGSFTGREAFYLQVNGDTLDGIVLRKDENGDFQDVTQSYSIQIKRA